MINIKTEFKSKFILYVVIVILTIITIIGFAKCEHTSKRTTESNDKTMQTDRKTTLKDSGTIEMDNITIEIETDKDGDTTQAPEPANIDIFKLTAYCSCVKCCGKWALNRPVDENGNEIVYGAIGERLREGYSIAVDPNIIPYRTEVIINGHIYKAQDCGGAIKGNRIDIYFEDHDKALEFGVQYADVYIK